MKKYIFIILSTLVFACSQHKGFEIDVNIAGANGQVLLERIGDNQWVSVDTADIVDGKAVLKGEVERPGDFYLSVIGQSGKAVLFVENSKMTVTGTLDSLNMMVVTGSKTHDDYQGLVDQLNEIGNSYSAVYMRATQANEEGDTATVNELVLQLNKLYDSTLTVKEDFIKNNSSSFAAPYILLSYFQDTRDYDELGSLLATLDPVLDSVPNIIMLRDEAAKMEKFNIGKVAPDFTQNDPDGNPVTFSDIYSQNEVTLLDFWAGWCAPCRQENPNVVAVYNEYKDEGFGVFGVSLDRTRDEWVNAIADDKLTWTHVSDLSYWDNPVARLYEITAIPANLLVDRNGVIIAKNKRGAELRETIAELVN